MVNYLFRRIIYAFVLIFVVSMITFAIIKAPAGDFASSYIASMSSSISPERRQEIMQSLRKRYGLGKPIYVQYFSWLKGIITKGDFGISMKWNMPVRRLILQRLPLTLGIGLITLTSQFILAIPIGIYSAVKKHTIADYIFTFAAFIGKSIPNFLLAIVVMVFLFNFFDISIGGLFSQKYQEAAWSFAKLLDLLKHLVVVVVVVGTAYAASTVRILRATMLDELGKDYMRTARSKGLPEWKAVLKYAARVALNPIIARVGWVLPRIISGSLIVSLVINIPTTGPLLYQALMSQDMYLAGAILLLLSTFTIFGTIVSDLLLAMSDPRITYEGEERG